MLHTDCKMKRLEHFKPHVPNIASQKNQPEIHARAHAIFTAGPGGHKNPWKRKTSLLCLQIPKNDVPELEEHLRTVGRQVCDSNSNGDGVVFTALVGQSA